MESSPFGVVAFQFTASAVSWRGRLNEYQSHVVGQSARYALTMRVRCGVFASQRNFMNVRLVLTRDYVVVVYRASQTVAAGESGRSNPTLTVRSDPNYYN